MNKCIKCNNEINDNEIYNFEYCRNCWYEIQDRPNLIKKSRSGSAAPGYIDGRWVNHRDNYMKYYVRNNLIWNKFINQFEKYTGEPCRDGFVRHHEYYDLDDVNVGIVFMTQSDHMSLHADIRFGRKSPVPIYCEIDDIKYVYNQELIDVEHNFENN